MRVKKCFSPAVEPPEARDHPPEARDQLPEARDQPPTCSKKTFFTAGVSGTTSPSYKGHAEMMTLMKATS
ncbi:hypothetical protein INR49_001122 [Caranx melampygus]|nr:hypothetical protein INR49_001122 [Caranx melampygus]